MYAGICSFRKSGNYLLIRMIKSVMQQLDVWTSYNNYSGCWNGYFEKDELAYPEEQEIDELYLDGNDVVLYKGRYRIPLNVEERALFNKMARLILTHQEPNGNLCKAFDYGNRKWLYIIRDGRAVINSLMHFLVSPVIMKRHPEYEITDVRKLYQLSDYVEKHIIQWRDHIAAFKKNRHDYIPVKYEDLISNKYVILTDIIKQYGVKKNLDIDSIIEDTSLNKMKIDAPQHVRKGDNQDWMNYYSDEDIRNFKDIAGDLLIEFGYEQNNDW